MPHKSDPWYARPRPVIAVAVFFGGLLLGNHIIADRPLPTLLTAAPHAAPAAQAAPVPIAQEQTPWSTAQAVRPT